MWRKSGDVLGARKQGVDVGYLFSGGLEVAERRHNENRLPGEGDVNFSPQYHSLPLRQKFVLLTRHSWLINIHVPRMHIDCFPPKEIR